MTALCFAVTLSASEVPSVPSAGTDNTEDNEIHQTDQPAGEKSDDTDKTVPCMDQKPVQEKEQLSAPESEDQLQERNSDSPVKDEEHSPEHESFPDEDSIPDEEIIPLDEGFYLKQKDSEKIYACYSADYFNEIEILLPEEAEGRIVRAGLFGCTGFILVENESGFFLFRTDFNSGKIKVRENVYDYILCDGTAVLLEYSEESITGRCININGKHIPCTVNNAVHLQRILEGNYIAAGNGSEWELTDMVTGKGMGQFSEHFTAKIPEEYNFIFTGIHASEEDMKQKGIPGSMFYKIYIDGQEAGRTETGSPFMPKIFTEDLTPDSFHIITAERWELVPAKQEYARSNNVLQPASVRLYIPGYRIIKLELVFDGREYRIESSPVMIPAKDMPEYDFE